MKQLHKDIANILTKKNQILSIMENENGPFYLYDKDIVKYQIKRFLSAIKGSDDFIMRIYYALKLNNAPVLLNTIKNADLGVDIASIREFNIATKAGFSNLSYFAPGKTCKDLQKLLNFDGDLYLSIDSFSELKKIAQIKPKKCNTKFRIRLHFDILGKWGKYGIHVNELSTFLKKASSYNITISSLHFHSSRNKDSSKYILVLEKLGEIIKKLPKQYLKNINTLNIGGGFEIRNHEGFYREPRNKDTRELLPAIEIEEYISDIKSAIKKYILPIIALKYVDLEPGRYLSSPAMHIAMKVVDVKDKHNIITNAGVNAVGWQRFEYEYFPIINLSNIQDMIEQHCHIYGNLCTPYDIWGYTYYGNSIKEQDILVVINQGSLTYSLAQNFINSIPKVKTI